MTFFLKILAEPPKATAYPFFFAHWIASYFIRQHSFECGFYTGVFRLNEFSTAGIRWLMYEASAHGRLRQGNLAYPV